MIPTRPHSHPSRCPALPLRATALAVGAVLLAIGAPAQAARWATVGPDKKAKVEIDLASIERTADGKVRVWHREIYATRHLQDTWAFSYTSVKQQSELRCDKHQAAVLRRIYYADSAGSNELKSEGFDGKDTAGVVPDTPLDAVFNRACRPEAKPAESANPAGKPATEPAKPADATPPLPAKPGKAKNGKETPPPPPKPPTPWGYDGKRGPAHWGKLDPDYAGCASGHRQSPIDIRGTIRGDLPPLHIAYKAVPLSITDDGHGIVVDASGGGTLSADGEDFELQALRFRRPGEEMVNGKRAAMSVQFEHRARSGRLAVLAVPLQESPQEHRLVRALWSALPLEPGKPVTLPASKIDPGQLLPAKREYYIYSGSLTTPPCTEGVLWLVMKQPVKLSREQVADFGRIYKNNARPVQAANGRVIKESR
jgi:carbonic anhydrase